MRKIPIIILILFLVSCSPYKSSLDSLGSQSSFSDVNIPDDFLAPEDEVDNNPIGEPNVTLPPVQVNLKNTFFLDDQIFNLAHGTALRWDGCAMEGITNGGYNSDSKCGRSYFHPSFSSNLNEAFYICVSDAARMAGAPQPVRVFIRHLGSYVNRSARNSSRLSNHAYARAWDIAKFILYDQEGNIYTFSTSLRDYKDNQATFYDEFRDCWRESLPSSCVPGNTEYKGSVGHQASRLGGNSLHNDHIHLSYPLCAGNS